MQCDHAVLVLEPHVRCPRVTQRPSSAVIGKNHFGRCRHALSLRSPALPSNASILPQGADAPVGTQLSKSPTDIILISGPPTNQISVRLFGTHTSEQAQGHDQRVLA